MTPFIIMIIMADDHWLSKIDQMSRCRILKLPRRARKTSATRNATMLNWTGAMGPRIPGSGPYHSGPLGPFGELSPEMGQR